MNDDMHLEHSASSKTDFHGALLSADELLDGCIAGKVRQLNRLITRMNDGAFRPFGLTYAQVHILALLFSNKAGTAVELGGLVDIEKSTMSRNLKRLIALGLAEQGPPAGRHGRTLSLTPKGKEKFEEVLPTWRGLHIKTTKVLTGYGENSVVNSLGDAAEVAIENLRTEAHELQS